ncbi:MAG: adenylosuccinate synthase [Marinilabiliales bacterium]|nr:MAG: adenylosuccinate synthase [Marinilabiliales bacterium]
MNVDVILGLQWGDEGKGKIVDAIADNYNAIARFQGGPNAGHTIEFDGNKFILHTIPSGIFHRNITNVIGNGVVLDPFIFMKEIEKVQSAGYDPHNNLIISDKANLILPGHRLLDAVCEAALGNRKIGSTLKGIGPAYTEKYQRKGFRTGDIFYDEFEARYKLHREEQLKRAKEIHSSFADVQIDGLPFEEYEEKWMHALDQLREFKIESTEILLNRMLQEGKKILAEGAQGSLLDVDFGSYPFVTSSNTTTGGVCTGLGVPPSSIGKVFGIFKAYCTRVGNGPFPTELHDHMGEELRKNGHEFGSTTGRPRRCGWLDLPALRYTIMINGVTDLVMTKADVLDSLETIEVANTYKSQNHEFMLPEFRLGMSFQPTYLSMKGWQTDITQITEKSDLPEAFLHYFNFIQKELNSKISYVSVGPGRKQIIKTN